MSAVNEEVEENENEEQSEDVDEISPTEAEMLKRLPPEAKRVLEVGMSMQRIGPMPNPIAKKINEKHIDKILDISAKDDERLFENAKASRKFTLIYVLIFAAIFVFITIYLVGSDKELYKEVIKLFAVFLGGLGGGFGLKSHIDRNK